MAPPFAPLDVLVESVRSALNARRLEALAPADAVQEALTRYVSAIEQRIARTFANDHQLKAPASGSDLDATSEARRLLSLVESLPELRTASTSEGQRDGLSRAAAETRGPPTPAAPALPHGTAASPITIASQPVERLSRALEHAPLVIVGGVAHPERLAGLDDRFQNQIEWIDTTRQGTHAIGNLERRIREGRVAALVMLEGSLSHKHSDPLVTAARHVALPCAYAGKGGRAALSRALLDIEAMLSRTQERS